MQPAVFIARLIGPSLVVAGVGVLLNEANYAAMIAEAAHSPSLIYLSGWLTLPLGLAILNVYRRWTADWRVIVTILGWLLAIGGIIRMVLPQFTAMLAITLYSTSTGLTVFAVVILLLGGYLSFEGYRAGTSRARETFAMVVCHGSVQQHGAQTPRSCNCLRPVWFKRSPCKS